MAKPSAFINTSRARVTAYLAAMEDMVSLQIEFNALGGVTFTNAFDFSGENASTYDMTQVEFNQMLVAIGHMVTAYQGGALTADATRQGNLYKGKM